MDLPQLPAPLDFQSLLLPIFHAVFSFRYALADDELTINHAGLQQSRPFWDHRTLLGVNNWYSPSLLPGARTMEIGGLLNARHAAAADAHMRQQQYQSMSLESQSYALNQSQNQMAHHHQSQLHDHTGMQYPSIQQQTQSQSHIYSTNFNAAQHNMKQETQIDDDDEDDFGSVQPKSEGVEKKYVCGTCPKGFARRSDLARHGMFLRHSRQGFETDVTTGRIHTGDKPHACEYAGCDKSFIQRSALTVHIRVHTGEKPHECETCEKVSTSDVSHIFPLTLDTALQRFELSGPPPSYPFWQAAVQMPSHPLSKNFYTEDHPYSSPEQPP